MSDAVSIDVCDQGFLGYVTVTLRRRFLDQNVEESMKSTLRNQFLERKSMKNMIFEKFWPIWQLKSLRNYDFCRTKSIRNIAKRNFQDKKNP